MANELATSGTPSPEWQAKQVYALAIVCLVIGLAVGYLFRGSQSPAAAPASAMQAVTGAPGTVAPAGMAGAGAGQQVTLEQMKRMADKQAEPMLAKLKDDPKNADLLAQIGSIYLATHQFKEAVGYFQQALVVKPKDIPIRTKLASCLFYAGDVDGALQQLTQATTDNPKDANSLFNLGMIRWQGKKDSKGALEAWAKLLKTNPKLEPAKKAQVEKLMADVRGQSAAN
jgi:tetratricopeptide (TPR) repeat protein